MACFRQAARSPMNQFVSSRKHGSFFHINRLAKNCSKSEFLKEFLLQPASTSVYRKMLKCGAYSSWKNQSTACLPVVTERKEIMTFPTIVHAECKGKHHHRHSNCPPNILTNSSYMQQELHSFDPLLVPIKSFKVTSDDIIIWDEENNLVTHNCCDINKTYFVDFFSILDLNKTSTLMLSDLERQTIVLAEGKQSTPPKQTSEESSGKPTEEQLHKAFVTLETGLPNLFNQPHDYNLYHKDIVFVNNIRGTTSVGISSYVKQITLLRTVAHFKFAFVKLDVLKITKHPEDSTVKVRWRIRGMSGFGVLRSLIKYRTFSIKAVADKEEAWYDGFSTFSVGQDGLIHRHVADKMMPDNNKEAATAKKLELGGKIALFLGFAPSASISDFDSLSYKSLYDDVSEFLLPTSRYEEND